MNITVGILENQPVFRESLVHLLEDMGLEISFHEGRPDPFLMALRAHPPQVALLDLRLDGEHGSPDAGLSVLRTIRAHEPAVAVIILSGADSPQVVEQCYREGAAAFLSKQSVDAKELFAAVTAVSQGQRYALDDRTPSGCATEPSPDPHRATLETLTPREEEVLSYIAGGADNLKIAACLNIRERTVKAHVTNLYRKLGPDNRAQMALLAREIGLLPPQNA